MKTEQTAASAQHTPGPLWTAEQWATLQRHARMAVLNRGFAKQDLIEGNAKACRHHARLARMHELHVIAKATGNR